MKPKKKQAKWRGKRKWPTLRGSESVCYLRCEIDVQYEKIIVRLTSLFHFSIHSCLSYSFAASSRGLMESPRTFPRSQQISLRMCLCDKAWRERKSSSTSGGSIRLTSAPAATGRSWCNNLHMTGGHNILIAVRYLLY